jgi:hypothetical protein
MSLFLLFAATAAVPEDLTICADRPSKANGACTVPAGHWQLEVSGPDWSRMKDGGARTDLTSFGSTFVKVGLDDASDLEAGVSPYIRLTSHADSVHDRVSGFGDLIVRYKRNLTATGAGTQVGLIPFVKIPTANHHLGNGKVEGGIIAPVSVATSAGITLTTDPEVDLLADNDGDGYHAALTNLVNVGFNPTSRLSLSAELWNDLNFDPAGTVRQWSLDGSAAYLPSKRLQIDAGANLGLNRTTPDVELYAGASVLF